MSFRDPQTCIAIRNKGKMPVIRLTDLFRRKVYTGRRTYC